MSFAQSAGEMTRHDPAFNERAGAFRIRYTFKARGVATERHIESVVVWAAVDIKRQASLLGLTEISWPPMVGVTPDRDFKGATIVMTVMVEGGSPEKAERWLQ